MDSNIITQLGIGGIFVIVVLRLVFDFLKNKNGKNNRKNHNPERCIGISRGEFDRHKENVQYRGTCEEITKRLENSQESQEKSSAQRHEFQQQQFKAMDRQFGEIKNMIGKLAK